MEQYYMPEKLDSKNLKLCLDNYEAESIFIRLVGSLGGTVKVREDLNGRKLEFRKDKSGLYFLVNENEIFHFPLEKNNSEKGFSLAYERIIPTEDEIGRMVMLSHGKNPYDPTLPEPSKSFLRHVLDDHLLEIYFKGRIHLKFHSWWDKKSGWKYWEVATPEEGKETQRALRDSESNHKARRRL